MQCASRAARGYSVQTLSPWAKNQVRVITSRSVSLRMSAGNAAKTRTTGLQWQATLGRRIGLQTDAFYGRSRFGPEVKLPSAVPPEFDWVGMHVAMTYALTGFRD